MGAFPASLSRGHQIDGLPRGVRYTEALVGAHGGAPSAPYDKLDQLRQELERNFVDELS